MAEGTRIRELKEHINAIEEKMLQLIEDCHHRIDEKLQQFGFECGKWIEGLAQHLEEIQQDDQQRYEAFQVEATRRHEMMLQENARRHEQLLKLLATQPQPPSPQSASQSYSSCEDPEFPRMDYCYFCSFGRPMLTFRGVCAHIGLEIWTQGVKWITWVIG